MAHHVSSSISLYILHRALNENHSKTSAGTPCVTTYVILEGGSDLCHIKPLLWNVGLFLGIIQDFDHMALWL